MRFLLFPALLLVFTACGPGAGEADTAARSGATEPATPVAPALEGRVLARHDSLMAVTGDLFVLRRRLTAGREAVVATRAPRLLARLDSATRATLRADDAMTDWMHAYHAPAPGTAPDSATAYFRRQLRALDVVDLLAHRALDSATAVLRALPGTAATVPPSR